MRWRRWLPVAAVLVAVVVAVVAILTFDDGGEVADFGEPPLEEGAALPGDVGLEIDDVDLGEPPPRDVVLDDATWEQVAGWVARENADGRPVIVNLWASWCEPCEREIPLLNEAAEEHPEIAFLGVSAMESLEEARVGREEFGIEFPAVHDADYDQIAFQVGARVLPTTVAFDTDGRMAARVIGELHPDSLDALLDSVQ